MMLTRAPEGNAEAHVQTDSMRASAGANPAPRAAPRCPLSAAPSAAATPAPLGARPLPAGPTREALAQIAADEEHHLAFHSQLFARQTRGRSWNRLLWWLIGLAACASVVIDHGHDLGALGVSRRMLGRALVARLHDGRRRIGSRRVQPILQRSV